MVTEKDKIPDWIGTQEEADEIKEQFDKRWDQEAWEKDPAGFVVGLMKEADKEYKEKKKGEEK